ncbi:hypothetical protein ACJIZ3_004445 [Penstemon smallii]|uniref:Uncharacterized protein n=1 Tax=Penstemon smallii TaxID=265156 RepID=A0ABD3S250_9LAMI
MFTKSKSRHSSSTGAAKNDKKKRQVAPSGCFSVYVGPEKQRFVISIEFSKHPLFGMLLEDAELEYGFSCDGPLLLPCEVDLFCNVLAEMEYSSSSSSCNGGAGASGFVNDGYGCSCSPFNNPVRRLAKSSSMAAQGCGSYGLLTPSRLRLGLLKNQD